MDDNDEGSDAELNHATAPNLSLPPVSRDRQDSSDEENDEEISSVAFKCLGATKQLEHQNALERAHKVTVEGGQVPVRLQFEPDNEVDSNALKSLTKGSGKELDMWRRSSFAMSEWPWSLKE